MKRAANSPTRSRPRKKAAASESTPPVETAAQKVAEPSGPRNVDPVEGAISLGLGVLVLIAALFPRSIKQLLLLSLGGGLVYRGMTRHSYFYKAAGIDTAKVPLLQQFNEKFLSLE